MKLYTVELKDFTGVWRMWHETPDKDEALAMASSILDMPCEHVKISYEKEALVQVITPDCQVL